MGISPGPLEIGAVSKIDDGASFGVARIASPRLDAKKHMPRIVVARVTGVALTRD